MKSLLVFLTAVIAILTSVSLIWAAEPIFEINLGSCSYGGGALADLDDDEDLEILFGTYYNDERVVVLEDDGTLHWELPSGGGPVDNSITAADLDGDGEVEVMWGNSGTTVFHLADSDGVDIWTYTTGEVLDAPEAIGDVNGDGELDIVLASCGSGPLSGLRAFSHSSNVPLWAAEVGGCYQSAPLLFDQDGDRILDVVVSTWFDNKVRAFSGLDGTLNWEATIGDWTYHAGSFGDLDGDGVPDVALGDYSATLWAINGATGAGLWSRSLTGETYIFGPTAMGDLDGNGVLDIVVTGYRLATYDADGNLGLSFVLPGFCARGPVLVDFDGDELPDILVALTGPMLKVYSGLDGSELYSHGSTGMTSQDFQPVVADLDGDDINDVFTVWGRGHSVDPENNWGVAAAFDLGGADSGWPTFSHDHHHSGNYHYPAGADANRILIFADGFEDGTTSAWSTQVP